MLGVTEEVLFQLGHGHFLAIDNAFFLMNDLFVTFYLGWDIQ